MDIVSLVHNTCKREGLLKYNDKVLIAVSGGADSVALLLILNNLKEKFNLTLHVAHLDHMLRKDSIRDANFVKRLCRRLNIPFTVSKINIGRKKSKLCLEETARNYRLDFLFKTAKLIKAEKIALAHHLDDQAETVLMRILRGTGLYGLAGISFVRRMGKIKIIRPLLNLTRRQIEEFLKERKESFCTDKSNSKNIYLRNKVRNELLPLLEKKYNRNIKALLFNLASCASSDYGYIKEASKESIKLSGGRIPLNKLTQLHPAVIRLKLREAIACVQGDTRRISFNHIEELEDLIFNRPTGSIVDLPKGISAIKKKYGLVFYLR